jgi:hypothetical protein
MTGVGYEVEWAEAAVEDLFARVKNQWVANELIHVAQSSLDDHYPPDGGAEPPMYWRRGLTVQRRTMLDAAQSRGEDCDHDEQPWHYVLYYRRQPRIIGPRGYLVLAVRRDREVLASLLDLLSHRRHP